MFGNLAALSRQCTPFLPFGSALSFLISTETSMLRVVRIDLSFV